VTVASLAELAALEELDLQEQMDRWVQRGPRVHGVTREQLDLQDSALIFSVDHSETSTPATASDRSVPMD